jgi:hypothetical protein
MELEDFSKEDMSLLEEDLKKNYNLVCRSFFDDSLDFLEILGDKILPILRLLNFGDVYELKQEIPNKISWLAGFSGRWDLFLEFYDHISYEEVFPESMYDRMKSVGEFYWKNEIVLFAVSGAVAKNQKSFFDSFISFFSVKDEDDLYNHLSTFKNIDNNIMKNAIQKCSKEMMKYVLSCENDDFREYVSSIVSEINQEHLGSSLLQIMFPKIF